MNSSLRVLNLEDNSTDAELNQAMLSARWPDLQFKRVATRNDYLAALEKGDIDLILSDYSMPGFDGQSALALAREKRPEVPFMFVSGTIGEDTAIEALKNGATDYVLKHRPLRLIPAVDRALREAHERGECVRAEEAMRQSEHKYRQLFECLADAAFLTEEKTGKIIDANRRAEELLGYTRAEILGHKQAEFLVLADEANPQSHLLHRDGTTFPVDVRVTHLVLHGRELLLRLCHEVSPVSPERL